MVREGMCPACNVLPSPSRCPECIMWDTQDMRLGELEAHVSTLGSAIAGFSEGRVRVAHWYLRVHLLQAEVHFMILCAVAHGSKHWWMSWLAKAA